MTPSGPRSTMKAASTRPPVVILGATGAVGRGVVEAALASGRGVVAVARDKAGLQALKTKYPDADLSIVPGSVANDCEGERLTRALRKLGRPFGGVVAAVCGSAQRGRLLDHPAAFLRRRLDEDLLPHLAAARHLLPLLASGDRGGTYVLIGGPGAEHPWAGYGHRSIGAAALRMLARVLHDEARGMGVRVQLLAVDSPVCTEDNRAHACAQWPSARAVGQRAMALVEQSEPAHAVVRYAALVPVDTDPVPLAPTEPAPVAATDVDSAPADSTKECGPERAPQESLLPSRCLQDARNLLNNLISPQRHQEPFPHDFPQSNGPRR